MKLKVYFRQIIVKFFGPLKKHPYWTVSASIIIGIVLYIGVDIVLAEVVHQNTSDIHMLASEIIIELGPCHIEESKTHAEMIKQYTEHLEQRQLAGVLRVLYPEYSPRKTLASARDALEKATKEEEAKETIWQAGLATNQLYKLIKRFPRSPIKWIKWFKSEDLPDWLLTDLNNAFDTTHELVDQLRNNPNREVAIAVCRADRRAILLLFLARLSYDNKEQIKSFLSDVEQARDCTRHLAKIEKDKKEQKFLYEVARSEDRRVKILGAMLDNDMEKVCELLTEAIEEAFEKEKGKDENEEISSLHSQ